MTLIRTAVSGVVVACGLAVGIMHSGLASAQPAPPAPVQGEQPPAWAPPKPAESWNGQPVVWNSAWGGRWGVWINGGFLMLTSNPVTGGG